MRHILVLPAILIFSLHCISQSQNKADMFRGNILHTNLNLTGKDLVYDMPAWKFYAAAPIRSTPLVNNNLVFFGTTKGDFFAVDKNTGQAKWKYSTGYAINSSAASQDGRIFFTDNKQTLYCLQQATGKKIWQFSMGSKMDYPWRFDYYYSSPVLYDNKLIVGGDDGYVYKLDQQNGKLNWKFKTKGLVRSTAALYNGTVLFGDTEGIFYAVDVKSGQEKWTFQIKGEAMNLEEYGFDRKAILAAPVVVDNKIIFGARDGYLYCLNATNGKQIWEVDHEVSWIISTVAVKDSLVVTGTSDGRFVQAINLNTCKEVWKFRPNSLFWSSPLIVGNKVYAGSFDGNLYCLDLKTGQRISQFSTAEKILSSPVWQDDKLYVGSDDGNLYSLSGHPDDRFAKDNLRRFVYEQQDAKSYFRNGSDQRIRSYLVNSGYKLIGQDSLLSLLTATPAVNTVIVLASAYLPSAAMDHGNKSLLRKFLDAGGRIILPGTNPIIYVFDEANKQPVAFAISRADSVLGINYGPNDTRAMGGQFSCFATDKGKEFGLPDFWNASLFCKPEQVDIVLGKNENELVSAFVKNFGSSGRFVQLYLHPDIPQNLDALIKLAERKL